MRRLRVVITRTRDGAPALLLASLLPVGATSCGTDVTVRDGSATTGAGGGSTSTSQGAGGASTSTGTGGTGGSGAAAGAGGAGGVGGATGPLCGSWEHEETFIVEVPPEGVPADPAALCSAPQDPAESNRSAFVTLHKYSQALHLATGAVEVDPSVLPEVVQTPIVEVASAVNPALLGMQVSNIQPSPTGYTFDASWPTPFDVPPDEWARMTLRVTLRVDCPTGPHQEVHAHTDIHLCADFGGPTWVSSGDTCTTCSQICEMAPSPAEADEAPDELPLARACAVGLRLLARAGRSQLLIAEHDGGYGLSYRWDRSDGELRQIAPDIVLWTPPDGPGPHRLSVVVSGADRVGIASLAAA